MEQHPTTHPHEFERLPDREGLEASAYRRRRKLHRDRPGYSLQAGIGMCLGIWLFLSPWILQYFYEGRQAVWNGFALGAAVILGSLVALIWSSATSTVVHPRWLQRWSGIVVLLGIWCVVSPWPLDFAEHHAGMWNAIACGGALILTGLRMFWVSARMLSEGATGGVPDPEASVLDTQSPPVRTW